MLLENCSAFCEIAASSRMRPPANASSCSLAWKLAKARLPRVSPNQIGHSADDKDDEANQTHLQQSVLERDAHLHWAQCCYVMIDRKASIQLTCETESGTSGVKTAVALLHYALVGRKSRQIRKRLHSRLRLSVLSSGQTAPRNGRLGHNDVFTIGGPRSGSNLSVPRGIFAPGSQ